MGRDRGGGRGSARRGRRSDPRLRGLSYEERRRVYRRRRIGAVVVIVALLVLLAILVGLIPLFGGSETGKASVENASHKLDPNQGVAREPRAGPAAKKLGAVKSGVVKPTDAARGEIEESSSAEPLDVLILGVDRRPEDDYVEGSRADTIMVARVFPDTGGVKMLSIPRDTFVEIEPGVEDRINAAYAYGGISQTAATVERFTGITVDRHAVVDFQGFEDIVNAVDGVTVDVKGEMPRGWRMEGRQTLDGHRALLYARYRGTPGGDLDRIARQQQVVSALHDKVLGWNSLLDLPEIARVTRENVETDSGIVESLSLGRAVLRDENGEDVEALQLKGTPTTLPDGRQVLMPDREVNERLVRDFERPDSS